MERLRRESVPDGVGSGLRETWGKPKHLALEAGRTSITGTYIVRKISGVSGKTSGEKNEI